MIKHFDVKASSEERFAFRLPSNEGVCECFISVQDFFAFPSCNPWTNTANTGL